MAIMPDEIQDATSRQDASNITYQYIKYMHEQLEFWGANRQREIAELQAVIADLQARVTTLEEALSE